MLRVSTYLCLCAMSAMLLTMRNMLSPRYFLVSRHPTMQVTNTGDKIWVTIKGDVARAARNAVKLLRGDVNLRLKRESAKVFCKEWFKNIPSPVSRHP